MEELIKRLISGSPEAWNEFVERFSRLIYKVFVTRSFRFSNEEVEELFNDYMVGMMKDNYRKIRMFEGRNQCSLPSYLKKIAINLAIDRRKKLIRTRMPSLNISYEGSRGDEKQWVYSMDSGAKNPNTILINQEEARLFQEALYRLAPAKLLVVVLIVYHKYDREELASLMKTTRQNIDVIFNRTKDRLKKIVKDFPKDQLEEEPACQWPEPILSFRKGMLLGERDTLLKDCIEKLTIPEELLVGLLFLNALAVAPTPDRLKLCLTCGEDNIEGFIIKALTKIVPA